MTASYNVGELKELMRSFYIFSGIRFILFDSEYSRLVSYPENDCDFCAAMKSCAKTALECAASDFRSFREAREKNGLILYKCHAGLVEAATVLRENGRIIGYLMFGQISDEPDRRAFRARLSAYCESFGLDGKALGKSIGGLLFKSDAQISAAMKIMEACTSYILLKELIIPESSRIFGQTKDYIEAHLGEDLNIRTVCEALKISRTKLYDIFSKEMRGGISAYIRERRMKKAKELLKATDKPIWEIAQSVGFPDYNYFSRVYKKICGMSPKNYRDQLL